MIEASRIFHCNVNCSNLERSLTFYRDLVGLVPRVHTVPDPQPGAAFGLETAQWDAWILSDARGLHAVALDLLEWKVPRPTGAPPEHPAQPGLARLGVACADVDGMHARLAGRGVDCFGPPHDVEVDGAPSARAFLATDPDGTLVEFVGGGADQLAFIEVNCTDLDRSATFYSEVVGLQARSRFGIRSDGAPLRIDGPVELESVLFDDPRGTGTFTVLLVEWKHPRMATPPSRAANHLGIFRLAFLTDAIDRDFEVLRALGVGYVSAPARLAMGPGLPDLRALLFSDPDGATLELIESPAPSTS